MLALGYFVLPFIKKIWSKNNTSSADTTFQGGDAKPPQKEEDKPPQKEEDKPPQKEEDKPAQKEEDKPPQKEEDKPPQKEEDQVGRMSTDQILQNPVWAVIYRRGWEERSVDLQRSQELRQHDQHLDEHIRSETTTCSSEHSEPSPAVKARTFAQQARVRKNLLKLKEKKKAKRQMANEQQCELAMPLVPILDPEASGVLDLLVTMPVQARTEKTYGLVDLEPDPTTLQFDWVEEVENFLQDHPTWNVL